MIVSICYSVLSIALGLPVFQKRVVLNGSIFFLWYQMKISVKIHIGICGKETLREEFGHSGP